MKQVYRQPPQQPYARYPVSPDVYQQLIAVLQVRLALLGVGR